MSDKKINVWYFGLEPLMERYTYQLSEQWIPATFEEHLDQCNFYQVRGLEKTGKINVGSVLDAYGRGVYAMQQCQEFMSKILHGLVKDGDIIYLQDFWTPGIEAVFYMLDLYGIDVKLYSMLHAQSVDEYDFTHAMKKWMRHFELGIDERHSGIFVGSTIHKEQLRNAGFKAPIHVVSLPLHKELAVKVLDDYLLSADVDVSKLELKKQVIYTSRLDKEKNPYFMVDVALKYLEMNPDHTWVVTTSADDFTSSVDGFVDYLKKTASLNKNFIIKNKLSKAEYYKEVAQSAIQFNSALQDYVSWTLLESTMLGCDVVYPNFRSFPEILDEADMYKPFNVKSAVNLLNYKMNYVNRQHHQISNLSDLGRRLEAYIMLNDIGSQEFNIWHESKYIEQLLKSKS